MTETTIDSIRKLAAEVERSHVAVAAWLKRDDWPFGRGPWRQDEIPAIREWRDALDDRTRDYRDEQRKAERYPFIDVNAREVMDAPGGHAHGATLYPEPLCLPFESEVIRGERVLTPEQTRAYVLAVVTTLKGGLFNNAHDECSWMIQEDIRKLGAKAALTRDAYLTCDLFAEHLAGPLGVGAVSQTRPLECLGSELLAELAEFDEWRAKQRKGKAK